VNSYVNRESPVGEAEEVSSTFSGRLASPIAAVLDETRGISISTNLRRSIDVIGIPAAPIAPPPSEAFAMTPACCGQEEQIEANVASQEGREKEDWNETNPSFFSHDRRSSLAYQFERC
jgi:hypothetical protein